MSEMQRILAALAQVPEERAELDYREAELIEAAREEGAPWDKIADTLGKRSKQAAQDHYKRLPKRPHPQSDEKPETPRE